MEHSEKVEEQKKNVNLSNLDIDQLCHLIDENTFGLKSHSSTKFSSIPAYQIKIFPSSRLKRLNSSLLTKSNLNDNSSDRTLPMDFSLPSSLFNRFRALSTSPLPQSQITSFPTKSILSSDEKIPSSSTESPCNMEELTAYFDHFLYLPKSLSSAAELMYT